jgi:DNA-binding transcriptional LysR family regulator
VQYDLLDLRLFLHVVSEGSITAGARRMHLSLPAASSRVRALEHHAGVPLLTRGRRGVRPTPAGTTLARHAREVLAHTARIESAVAGYASAGSAALRLLAGSSATHRLVPVALAGFLTADDVRLDVCVLREPWATRGLSLCRGATDQAGSPAAAALAEHLHRAAGGAGPGARRQQPGAPPPTGA